VAVTAGALALSAAVVVVVVEDGNERRKGSEYQI
jgi:hypothetical protein